MSLRGYIKKGKPALWLSMRGGKTVAEVRPGKPLRRSSVRRETPESLIASRLYRQMAQVKYVDHLQQCVHIKLINASKLHTLPKTALLINIGDKQFNCSIQEYLNGKRLRRSTPQRAAEQRQYLKRSREWLVGKKCLVTQVVRERLSVDVAVLPATQVHHRNGRRGRLLNWEPGWIPVSQWGQNWVHNHPAEAVELGLVGPTGTWNDYERAVAHERKTKGKT